MNAEDPHDIIRIPKGQRAPKGYVAIPEGDVTAMQAASVEERGKYLAKKKGEAAIRLKAWKAQFSKGRGYGGSPYPEDNDER